MGSHADGQPKVLYSDEEQREQLAAVLGDDVTYLGSAREQVAEAARVATESAAQRLQSHQYLSLVQTTVIGSVLLALTAIQALAYELPVPERLHAPLIALLSSSGLVLPLLVGRRRRGGTGGRIGGVLEIGVGGCAVGAVAKGANGNGAADMGMACVGGGIAGGLLGKSASLVPK
ncbi:hypothetical protein [Streptomyces fungicidicus]|uniref:hypothetical protein n=1 Tax=Streptomyces fungicidicus TaxID=68203 RepID=UPI0037F14EBA